MDVNSCQKQLNIGIMISSEFQFLYCIDKEKSLDKTIFVFWTYPCDIIVTEIE